MSDELNVYLLVVTHNDKPMEHDHECSCVEIFSALQLIVFVEL